MSQQLIEKWKNELQWGQQLKDQGKTHIVISGSDLFCDGTIPVEVFIASCKQAIEHLQNQA